MASRAKNMARVATSALAISILIGESLAQTAPNCPLWGPVYPAPVNVLKSTIVPKAASALKESLESALKNGTLGASNSSFHLSVFSTDSVLLDFSFAAPGAGLTSGVLDRNTIFRTGSLGKFLTVYALLIATGMRYINDPVTKWVPELTAADDGSDVNVVRWQEITIGALASHMAGLTKECKSIHLPFMCGPS
jgi:CubicO group peptidase (beta-lactamase class C family)